MSGAAKVDATESTPDGQGPPRWPCGCARSCRPCRAPSGGWRSEVLENPRGVAASTITELGAAVRHLRDHGHPVLPDPRPVRLSAAPPDPGHRVRPRGQRADTGGRQRHRPGRRPRGRSSRRSPSPTPAPSRRPPRSSTSRRLQAVVDALVAAGRIDIYGVGASAFVAMDFQQKLHRIGQIAFAWSDTHIALTSAALLRPGRRGDRHLAHRHHDRHHRRARAGPPPRRHHRRPHQLPALADRRGGRPRADHGRARDDVPLRRDGEPAGAADPGRLPVRRGRPADHRRDAGCARGDTRRRQRSPAQARQRGGTKRRS